MHLLPTIFWRTINGALLLLTVLVLNFLLIHMAPGDAADVIAGSMGGANSQVLQQIRITYGLNQPLHVQLWRYLGRVARGDLGYSIYYNRPVMELILDRLWPTILLVLVSLVLAVLIGTLLGVFAAEKPSGLLSHTVTVLALVAYALPVFWTGIMLVILLADWIPLFPVSGMFNVAGSRTGFGYALDVLYHLVLPVLSLSTIYLAVYSRLARASMLDVLGSDYVRTARGKGLTERLVVYKHALRNAVLPVVTYAGLQFGNLLSGAVLVETVYSWPGLGTLAFDSILRRDAPTLLGILFFSAIIVVVANLLTDMSYRLIDPRIRIGVGR